MLRPPRTAFAHCDPGDRPLDGNCPQASSQVGLVNAAWATAAAEQAP
jgi:hypothetical protein